MSLTTLLSVVVALSGVAAAALKVWMMVSSDSARLRRREVREAREQGRVAVERERLEATNARIDREVPKAGQELLDRINDQLR